MELGFHDSSKVPAPPSETRILTLTARPWPDRRRIAVEVHITPFQQRPDLHLAIHDKQGVEAASLSALQVMQTQVGFTMHLRRSETKGEYTVSARLSYADPDLNLGEVDRAETTIKIR